MPALDRDATPTLLRQLAQGGALDGRQLAAGLRLLDARADRAAWRTFADKLLLVIGIGLVVTGVVFFFAANWDAVSQSARIGLALGAQVIAVVAAATLGLRRPAGRAAAAGAALLIGPALLTYGQAYQTGADAWELFFAWAALATPFAIVVRGTALWAVVLGLFRGAAFLYASQADGGNSAALVTALCCLAVDAVAVVIAERRAPGGRAALVFVALGLLTQAPFLGLALMGELRGAGALVVAIVLAGLVAHGVGLVRSVSGGRTPETALIGLSAALHLGIAVARVLFDELGLDEGGLFLFGAFVLLEASALALVLGAALKRARAGRAS